MKRVFGIILIAATTSLVTVFAAQKTMSHRTNEVSNLNHGYTLQEAKYTAEAPQSSSDGGYVNLESAAEKSSKAVVHITTKSTASPARYYDPFEDFFGGMFGQRRQMAPQKSTGSGVVISEDGYIVTNNHVVAGADEVEVTYSNKKTVKAKVIGTDPSTDLAVLKVEDNNLPYLTYGNSDNVKLGEWVLAVGYPLNLETTVTAGIVSAKYRNIGINQRQAGANAVESFIQTDAAVNPGNSGGALVNARGELIGINSAIASPTGSYAGYSYAIPANLVKKVVNDMVEYGKVQRAYLGVSFVDGKTATPEMREQYNLDNVEGVVVAQVMDESGADDAGLKEGDIIKSINAKPIKTGTQLQEVIAQQRPGDRVTVMIERSGKTMTKNVELRNSLGNTDVLKNEASTKIEKLGAQFRELSAKEKQQFRTSGVMITSISNGALRNYTRIREGFVIISVNEIEINSLQDLKRVFNSSTQNFQIGGVYPGKAGNYFYSFRLN